MRTWNEIVKAVQRLKSEQSWGTRRIASNLGLSRRRVTAILRGEHGPPPSERPRFIKLVPHRERIVKLVTEGLTGQRVFEDLAERGHDGSYTVLKDFIRELKAGSGKEAVLRLTPREGKVMQFDWSPYRVEIGTAVRNVFAMSLILVYSRRLFVTFALRQHLAAILRSIVAGVRYHGGSAARFLTDNHAAMVAARVGSKVRFQERMRLCAAHFGFELAAARVRRPQDKGAVERPFRWIEQSFLKGRKFASLDDLNARMLDWLEKANARVHSTFGETVTERYEREQPYLVPLPDDDFDTRETALRVVALDSTVQWDVNSYSVPPTWVGKTVVVRADDLTLAVEDGAEEIARHEIAAGRHQRVMAKEHEAAIRAARRRSKATRSRRDELRQDFIEAFGEVGKTFLDGLVETQRGASTSHMERLLALRDEDGDAVRAAIERALHYGAFSAATVERILDVGASARPRKVVGPRRPAGSVDYPDVGPVTTASLEQYEQEIGSVVEDDDHEGGAVVAEVG